MLVNDCGPEADEIESNIKKSIKDSKNFSYYRNPKNLGFIGNCNRAVLELEKTSNDILLLNSDTKVTKGWLDEMLGVLDADSKIGVVSPRSNNATITTVPLSSVNRKGINADDSFELFHELKKVTPRYNEAPTAHGFCMLIRRDLIRAYGLFDEVFGRGYGEEVDFCLRLRKHGYKSVISNHSFVFHLEARSFSLETKAKLLETNNQIIRKRYPGYQRRVRAYIDHTIHQEEGIVRRYLHKASLAQTVKSKTISLLKRNKLAYRAAKHIHNRISNN